MIAGALLAALISGCTYMSVAQPTVFTYSQ